MQPSITWIQNKPSSRLTIALVATSANISLGVCQQQTVILQVIFTDMQIFGMAGHKMSMNLHLRNKMAV